MFDDKLIREFVEWKNANPRNYSWWSFVNYKADLQTALGFAKFFYPEIVEVDGCFLLKDNFYQDTYEAWKQKLKNKKQIEKIMNLYELRDFFHINTEDDGNFEEQVEALGDVLTLFWSMSFKNRFPNRSIKVEVFEDDDEWCITVYEE